MFWRRFFPFALVLAAVGMPAQAATVSIALKDKHGAPAADAVVTLTPLTLVLIPRTPETATIDQRQQTFLPLVVAIRRGGRVVFTNNDNTMHQVYSFSAIKQFEYEIEKGHRSPPVEFDKAGIAAIGCNIHDNMIAYVFVTDAPITVITDAKGVATAADVPVGSYRGEIWHPRLVPGSEPTIGVTVTETGATIEHVLSLTTEKMPSMHKQHMQSY